MKKWLLRKTLRVSGAAVGAFVALLVTEYLLMRVTGWDDTVRHTVLSACFSSVCLAVPLTLAFIWVMEFERQRPLVRGVCLGVLAFAVTTLARLAMTGIAWPYLFYLMRSDLLRWLAAGLTIGLLSTRPVPAMVASWLGLVAVDYALAFSGWEITSEVTGLNPRNYLINVLAHELCVAALLTGAFHGAGTAKKLPGVLCGLVLGILAWATIHLPSYASSIAGSLSFYAQAGALQHLTRDMLFLSAHNARWVIADGFRTLAAGLTIGLIYRD